MATNPTPTVEPAQQPAEITPLSSYGPAAAGASIPFTGYTPMLGVGPANVASTTGAVQFNGYSQVDNELAHFFRVPGGRTVRRLLRTLLGVAPGATAQEFRSRVQGKTGSPGGLQTIEQVPYVNRVTTAADVAGLTALLDRTVFPTTYPVDVGGNGGGGQLKYKGIG